MQQIFTWKKYDVKERHNIAVLVPQEWEYKIKQKSIPQK